MKNIRFEFQGALYDIQAERQGDMLTLIKDGLSYQVNLAPGAIQTVSNQYVSAVPRGGMVTAVPAAATVPVQVTPAAPVAVAPVAAPAPSAVPAVGGSAEVAPITGTIKEIKVAAGQRIKTGDLLIIMEAMKMDIEVFAAGNGSVASILVSSGDSVKEKQALINLA